MMIERETNEVEPYEAKDDGVYGTLADVNDELGEANELLEANGKREGMPEVEW